ncbi:MAG TPA: aminotransferase class V-fold PLP-dependent enzyme [Mycobacteriales bacterium]
MPTSAGSPPDRQPSPANPLWGPDWLAVRAHWPLDPALAHLNHGGFGAVPLPVLEHQDRLRQAMERNPNAFFRDVEDQLDQARLRVAAFLGSDPDGVVFVPNATTGISTVLASVPLSPEDELLVTSQTYPAIQVAAEHACRRSGARLVVADVPLPADPSARPAEPILAAVTDRTRLAIVDHVASRTGVRFPIEELVAGLRQRGVRSLVDAAHAPGLFDVRLEALAADYWVGNFHKWCCSPRGAAALYVAPEHRERLAPLVTSVGAPAGYPSSFGWLGTDDYTPYLCVPAAIAFLESLGWDRLRGHNRALARMAEAVVRDALGGEVAVDTGFAESMALVALPPGLGATPEAAGRLWSLVAEQLRAEVAVVAVGGRGYLRLSAQAYNAPAEYERLAAALPAFLARQAGEASSAAS